MECEIIHAIGGLSALISHYLCDDTRRWVGLVGRRVSGGRKTWGKH